MKKEAAEGRKPHRAIMPLDVPKDKMWDLDVDDPIWIDVGLGWSEPGGPLVEGAAGDGIDIPRWMGDDGIRQGMRALGLHDRAGEEKVRLSLERDTLQLEAREVWGAINHLLDLEVDPDYKFQWEYRRQMTLKMIIDWSRSVIGIPSDLAQSENWGPEYEEMRVGVKKLVFTQSPDAMDGIEDGTMEVEGEDEIEEDMEENALADEDHAVEEIVAALGFLDTM